MANTQVQEKKERRIVMGWIDFTCGECGHKYTEQTGDVDERVCDECLNHEDEFGCPGYHVDASEDGQTIIPCEHKECKEHNNG